MFRKTIYSYCYFEYTYVHFFYMRLASLKTFRSSRARLLLVVAESLMLHVPLYYVRVCYIIKFVQFRDVKPTHVEFFVLVFLISLMISQSKHVADFLEK